MQAYASSSGGVMFIPETIERKSAKKSYKAMIKDSGAKIQPRKSSFFGKRKAETKVSKAA